MEKQMKPEPASETPQVLGLIRGHALREEPDFRLVTLCGLQLPWGRVEVGILPSCKKCRVIFLEKVSKED